MALELEGLLERELDAAFNVIDRRVAQREARYLERVKEQAELLRADPTLVLPPLSRTLAARIRTAFQVNVLVQRSDSVTAGGGLAGPGWVLQATVGRGRTYQRQENFALEIDWLEAYDTTGRLTLDFTPGGPALIVPTEPQPPPTVTAPTPTLPVEGQTDA